MKRPLNILVTEPGLLEWPKFQELIGKGDAVNVLDSAYVDTDVVFGPRAHFLTFEMLPYVDSAIKRAREKKYGKPSPRKHNVDT